jgi:hypothetical protein
MLGMKLHEALCGRCAGVGMALTTVVLSKKGKTRGTVTPEEFTAYTSKLCSVGKVLAGMSMTVLTRTRRAA